MANNPYAPPTSAVRDVHSDEVPPDLWNPNAAASWSLFFSPLFGSILHMKNWEALGKEDEAKTAKGWAIATGAILIPLMLISAFFAESKGIDALVRLVGLVLLLSWYFLHAKKQAKYVREHFGKDYPRRGWGKPILFAVLIVVGFVVVIGVIAGIAVATHR